MSTHADAEPRPATEGADCSKFQLRTLAVIAALEGAPKGLAVKAGLEEYYGEEINHGRLYPNLDELVERGFIAKGTKDRRTNAYGLTDRGRDVLREEVRWLNARAFGASDGPQRGEGL